MFGTMQIAKVAAFSLLFSVVSFSPIKAEENKIAEAKRLFIFVETVSRLEEKEQIQHIQKMYQEVFPSLNLVLMHNRLALLPLQAQLIYREDSTLSPEELADSIIAKNTVGWLLLYHLSEKRCLNVLKKNHEHLIPFLKEDIVSKKKLKRERALLVIGSLRLRKFFDSVLHVFETDVELSSRASYTLRDIGDPRAIAPMVKKYPDLATNMVFEILRRLQTKSAADPSLIRLLKSNDPEVRWRASYALTESGDPNLIPYVFLLAKDKDARVRKQASEIGFSMKGKYFKKVRHILVTLLSDSNKKVRSFTAICFAQRKDNICAQTLLELLKDTSMNEWEHSNIVQSIHSLTGSYFGYYLGSDAWKPTTKNNKQAIKNFTNWVNENVVNKISDDGL